MEGWDPEEMVEGAGLENHSQDSQNRTLPMKRPRPPVTVFDGFLRGGRKQGRKRP